MFKFEPINPPKRIPAPGGDRILDVKCTVLERCDPRQSEPVQIRTMEGFMDGDRFIDYGDHVVDVLDREGYTVLLADTRGGKRADDFRLSDIRPAITARKAAIKAAKAAALAEQERLQAEADAEDND